jgi:DmsE family decaheme c-type cytochrome
VFHEGRRPDTELGPGWPKAGLAFRPASLPALQAELPIPEGAEYVNDDDECLACHEDYEERYHDGIHRSLRDGNACEACHGPGSEHVDSEGEEPGLVLSFKSMNPVQRSEVCLACHSANACSPNSNWRTSVHAHKGVACTDCHAAHQEPEDGHAQQTHPERRVAAHSHGSLGAAAQDLCYKCHGDMAHLKQIAGPHQIGGPNGFQCNDCHDPHGMIRDSSRRDLCLSCHDTSSPTMAWHSSLHGVAGVACTDCHHPHPRPDARHTRDIRHATVSRPERLPMSVQQPETCYKCHPKIFGMTAMPSHHPIREGKMVCSDCHDAHGQAEKGLREPTLNQVCFRCHAEKQGPFAYDHPPVTEDCSICHEAHGTVNDDLLRQPATFLCLRCHSGHRSDHRQLDGTGAAVMQRALYGDCTLCHSHVHGSDLINETLRGRGLTR